MNVKLFLKDKINTNPTIIEAGTSTGYDTLEFSQIFPNATIYGFEPIIDLYEKSVKNNEFNTLMESLGFLKIWDDLSIRPQNIDAGNFLYENKNI